MTLLFAWYTNDFPLFSRQPQSRVMSMLVKKRWSFANASLKLFFVHAQKVTRRHENNTSANLVSLYALHKSHFASHFHVWNYGICLEKSAFRMHKSTHTHSYDMLCWSCRAPLVLHQRRRHLDLFTSRKCHIVRCGVTWSEPLDSGVCGGVPHRRLSHPSPASAFITRSPHPL